MNSVGLHVVIHTSDAQVLRQSCLPSVVLPGLFAFLSPEETYQAATVCTQWQQGALAARTLRCGPKHDNLVLSRVAVPRTVASFPPFFGFTDAQIKGLFKPETRELWQKICTSKNMDLLPELQKLVENDILLSPLPLTSLQRERFAKFAGKTLIVRSSSNEDTNVVNAGGNESVKDVLAKEESVRVALAKVVASYFGAQSFKNRSAFEDPFKAMPACSVLVMEQLCPTVSGVMITHKAAWFHQREERVAHIVGAHGFAAGTSGKIPTDEWVLTQERLYSKFRGKTPCLTEAQLRRLQIAGCYLEGYFQKPQDVEFVYQGNELSIVQTRGAKAPEMRNPSFLDASTIPVLATRFQSTALIPGLSQVLKLPGSNILFTEDLDEANYLYRPGFDKAVVIYVSPASANTHEEMNFSSQRPPVPCFLLPSEEWRECRKLRWNNEFFNLCPQTGLIVVMGEDLPVRKGLFLHPARFAVSADGPKGVSTHPRIERLRTLLTATPEQLSLNLSEIRGELTHLFMDISQRTAAKHFRQVTHHSTKSPWRYFVQWRVLQSKIIPPSSHFMQVS